MDISLRSLWGLDTDQGKVKVIILTGEIEDRCWSLGWIRQQLTRMLPSTKHCFRVEAWCGSNRMMAVIHMNSHMPRKFHYW